LRFDRLRTTWRDCMEKERRSASLVERRRSRTPAVFPVSSDSDRFSRRIGPAWLSVAQLSRRWQLSRKTIYKFIDAGILPVWKVGGRLYRIALADVVRFETHNKLPPK